MWRWCQQIVINGQAQRVYVKLYLFVINTHNNALITYFNALINFKVLTLLLLLDFYIFKEQNCVFLSKYCTRVMRTSKSQAFLMSRRFISESTDRHRIMLKSLSLTIVGKKKLHVRIHRHMLKSVGQFHQHKTFNAGLIVLVGQIKISKLL